MCTISDKILYIRVDSVAVIAVQVTSLSLAAVGFLLTYSKWKCLVTLGSCISYDILSKVAYK